MLKNTSTAENLESERFDYTKWRKEYFGDMTIKDISNAAAEYEQAHPFNPKKPQLPL